MNYSKSNRINKYSQTPEFILDLHGLTTIESRDRLAEVIDSEEYSHIRVIVGRGLNSEHGPVLPYFVRNYLTERGIRYNQSKIQEGGEGSLEVFLK